jgi:hypothetical protein
MKAIRSHYLCRRTSVALALLMLVGLVAPGLSAWAAPVQTVLVYPVTVAADNAPANIGENATSALTMALDATPGFDALQFSATAPSVRRAISEGRVRQVDVDEGSHDLASALSIGQALHADLIVLASLQSYTAKENSPLSVEVILAGQMYAVAANLNPATGEAIAEPKVQKAFGVSGASAARAKYRGDEQTLAQEALRDAAFKAAQTLAGLVEVGAPTAVRKKGSNLTKWALLGVLLVGLAIAVGGVGGGGGDGGGPAPTAAPPENVVVTPFEDHIQVSWQPPPTTPSFYQVQRAVDGGSFSFFDGSGNVPNSQLFKNDYSLIAPGTHIYQYRVRAVYGGNTFSPYVLTGATQWPAP